MQKRSQAGREHLTRVLHSISGVVYMTKSLQVAHILLRRCLRLMLDLYSQRISCGAPVW